MSTIPARQTLRGSRGQAMTELVLALPVIFVFLAAVFYFGHGMNQKIENTMAVHLAAFVEGRDSGRDPDDKLPSVTAAQLESAFFSRGQRVQVEVERSSTPSWMYALWAWNSFNVPAVDSSAGWLKWLPNTIAGAYLSFTGLPAGVEVTTRTTIKARGTGFGTLLRDIGDQTVQASLYVDSSPRKLETASFNLGDSPSEWDFGAFPIYFTYMAGWDWDFAQRWLWFKWGDTPWP
jgi:Flp pilus assembly protein TadG